MTNMVIILGGIKKVEEDIVTIKVSDNKETILAGGKNENKEA